MKNIHHQEKEQFKKLFEQGYIDRFEDRFNILEVFLQTENHLTSDELIKMLDEKGIKLHPEFVYETLEMMCRFGFAHKNRFQNGHEKYEHRHLGQHHDHMICTKCKRIIEFEEQRLENLQREIASSYQFHMLQHKMEIYGICSECLENRVQLMPLAMAKRGERVTIKEISGGSRARMRLLTMGLKLEDEVEIITSHNNGQLVIAVDCNRYVLGRGFARKILVKHSG